MTDKRVHRGGLHLTRLFGERVSLTFEGKTVVITINRNGPKGVHLAIQAPIEVKINRVDSVIGKTVERFVKTPTITK